MLTGRQEGRDSDWNTLRSPVIPATSNHLQRLNSSRYRQECTGNRLRLGRREKQIDIGQPTAGYMLS
jgi:hypothetical protein